MKTFYLIDFENVHNEGMENIDSLSKDDHVHIFSTKNASTIRMDLVFSKGIDIQGHIVPARKQSLDMHLVSYLGNLLGINGQQCSYVIVSKDTDYDNIIKFWKEEGYPNISRKEAIPGNAKLQKQATSQKTSTTNGKISASMAYVFSGRERSKLNVFMQRGLVSRGYAGKTPNQICKYVIAHCNDERMLSDIHNDLKNNFDNYAEIYEDVKTILERFVSSNSKVTKRETQVRSFFGQHFKKKIYTDRKEDIINVILSAQTRQQVNSGLMQLYSDGNVVKHIYQTVQPLIRDLPEK
ncbi:MAG: hypothetical protein K2O32_11890 [Acetatifactor sp.]|nr:hypothetical protein [Acetatifactor sp.]